MGDLAAEAGRDLAVLRSPILHFRSDCRIDRRRRRAAAGDGVRHRVGRDTAGRNLHGDCRGISRLSVRRLADSDWRSHRRLRRHRGRDHRRARHLRPVDGDHDGRGHPRRPGLDRSRAGGEVHSAPGRCRLHERDRPAHRVDADQGLLRPCHSGTAAGVLLADGGARARDAGSEPHRVDAGRRIAGAGAADSAMAATGTRIDRRPGGSAPLPFEPFTCRSRPSGRSSAAFRAACRHLPFQRSAPTSFSRCCQRRSRSRCWRRSRACSRRSSPIR